MGVSNERGWTAGGEVRTGERRAHQVRRPSFPFGENEYALVAARQSGSGFSVDGQSVSNEVDTASVVLCTICLINLKKVIVTMVEKTMITM